MPHPAAGDYAPYYEKYIQLVKGESVDEIIKNHSSALKDFYNNLPESKADFAYADKKWTVKELLQHLIDAERVFSYRALRISRKDETPLPSFDENSFAENSNAGKRNLDSLKKEWNAVRTSTDLLLQSFTNEQLNERGVAGNNPVTGNAIAFIMYGHLLHHQNILTERYL